MANDSFLFGGPLVGLAIGALVMVFGIFQGGLNPITLFGGVIGAASIVLLSYAVFQASG
ncbi:hypothetical protein OB955_12890 [Halobacteria archaeon AArc-m2/3/4]|uniref:Uncharacterized protein n=1 Tax=Natronoglomus mannanivorans TaxID=2979990 RepID=A0AAP2YXW6_9EURY|nr:hypothetical protein [Halobacteria archaeon AArc-xg1-1]MCU4973630.1 hypothetical protein [Halobacteria archaeon AArc-m2/3/4]